MTSDNKSVVEANKRVQRSIDSFFGGSSSGRNINKKKSKREGRMLQATTANKWKTTSLAKYSADEWLIINTDESGNLVKSMQCSTCTMFEKNINSLKGFAPQWSGDGSTRLQHSAAAEHAQTDAHTRSYDLYLTQKGLDAFQRTEKNKQVLKEQGQHSVIFSIAAMNKKDLELTKTKFETAYFIAKEELPLLKYPKLLQLEERHGVEIGLSYRNENTGGLFIDVISESLAHDLREKLGTANFYSVLTDGSADAAMSENEAVFVVYFDPFLVDSAEVKIVTAFVKLVYLKSADAQGLVKSIKDAFNTIGIDVFEKLVGFGSDDASVNKGWKSSVKTMLQDRNPWLTFGWCAAHRLELALKDALHHEQLFKDVDDIILRLYYLYKKSPKKLRQLKELFDMYEENGEFLSNGYRPKKVSGS